MMDLLVKIYPPHGGDSIKIFDKDVSDGITSEDLDYIMRNIQGQVGIKHTMKDNISEDTLAKELTERLKENVDTFIVNLYKLKHNRKTEEEDDINLDQEKMCSCPGRENHVCFCGNEGECGDMKDTIEEPLTEMVKVYRELFDIYTSRSSLMNEVKRIESIANKLLDKIEERINKL